MAAFTNACTKAPLFASEIFEGLQAHIRPQEMRIKNQAALLLIILAFATTWPMVGGWNDASRMATIQSLVERRSFVIDESVFVDTGDKVRVGGHFYSDKPPMASLLGAIVYLPLSHLGIKLDYGWNLAYYLITLLTVKLFWLIGLAGFYSALGLGGMADEERLWLTVALGIGSLHFTWSSTFNNHSLAASQLFIGFYFLLKARSADHVKRNLFCAGLFLALAGAVDIPTMAFYVGFSFLVTASPNLRGRAFFYLLPLIFTALPALAVNYFISGSVVPMVLSRAYLEWPGSPWVGSNELSGMKINDASFFLRYSLGALVGRRGFLLYNPLLLIALPCLAREMRVGRRFRQEALVVGVASLVVVLYYLLFTTNYGGWSYSVRWFVPLLPLSFFFMRTFLREAGLGRRRVFVALLCVSSIVSCIGLIDPWSNVAANETPLISNMELWLQLFR